MILRSRSPSSRIKTMKVPRLKAQKITAHQRQPPVPSPRVCPWKNVKCLVVPSRPKEMPSTSLSLPPRRRNLLLLPLKAHLRKASHCRGAEADHAKSSLSKSPRNLVTILNKEMTTVRNWRSRRTRIAWQTTCKRFVRGPRSGTMSSKSWSRLTLGARR